MKKAGPVFVDLLDKDGNKLRTLLTETQQEKSRQRQELDLSDLPARTSVKSRLKAARKLSGL